MSRVGDNDFERRLWSEVEDRKQAEARLRRYLATDEAGRPLFTGARFDLLDRPQADTGRFTSADLVAITMLSVRVRPSSAIELLEGNTGREAALLLKAIGPDRDLWSTDEASISDGSPADQLWRLLKRLNGVGWVTANKLMARKRPRLIPVYDSVVQDALRPGRGNLWPALRTALQNDNLRSRIDAIQGRVDEASHLSTLRVIDIVVWMNHWDR